VTCPEGEDLNGGLCLQMTVASVSKPSRPSSSAELWRRSR